MLPRLIHDVIDFCYPCLCAHCGQACETSDFLCEQCQRQLRSLEVAASCEKCAMPLAEFDAPCPFCLDDGVAHYQRILRLGTFDEPLKDLIHKMKYGGRWTLAERLARRLWDQPRIRKMVGEADVMVPIPLHFFRRMRRGFNQAGLVARVLAERGDRPVLQALSRTRNTQTQTHLHSKMKRFENLRDAFALKCAKEIRGKHVLVIDDVMTTGVTLQTAARALRAGKPASISAIVLAVADPRGRNFQSA